MIAYLGLGLLGTNFVRAMLRRGEAVRVWNRSAEKARALEAEGAKQAVILAAEAQMKALELQAEGEKKARQLRGEGEAASLTAIDQAAIHPNTLAVLQLRALQDIAASPNSKVVVPYEAVGLVGGAEALIEALKGSGPPAVGAAKNGSAVGPAAG